MLSRMLRFRFSHDAIVYFIGGIPIALLLARASADIILTLAVICFLIRSARARDWRWAVQKPYALLLVLWAYLSFVSAPLGLYPHLSAGLALAGIRFPLFFIAATYWILRDARDLRYLAWFVGITLLIMGVDTFTQWATGLSLLKQIPKTGDRLSGSMHTLNAGGYIAKLWFPSLGLFLSMTLPHRGRIAVVVLLAVLLMPLVALSGERSATLLFFLAFCASLGFAAFALPRLRLWLGGAVALAIAGLVLLALYNPFVNERALFLKDQLGAFGETPYGQLWKGAGLLWQAHPATGGGIGSFRKLCPAFRDAHLVTYCDIHIHNHYLEWLAEGGVIGLALYLAFLFMLLKPLVAGACALTGVGVPRHPEPQAKDPATAAGSFAALRMTKESHPGSDVILLAAALGTFILCLFPLSVTQSFFSNWAATLHWFALACAASMLKAGSGHGSRVMSQAHRSE